MILDPNILPKSNLKPATGHKPYPLKLLRNVGNNIFANLSVHDVLGKLTTLRYPEFKGH